MDRNRDLPYEALLHYALGDFRHLAVTWPLKIMEQRAETWLLL